VTRTRTLGKSDTGSTSVWAPQRVPHILGVLNVREYANDRERVALGVRHVQDIYVFGSICPPLIGSCRVHCVVESCRVVPLVIVEHIYDARWFARATSLSCPSSRDYSSADSGGFERGHVLVSTFPYINVLSCPRCRSDSASLLQLPRHGRNFAPVPSCWRETV
jgi:hypothetical protein